MKQAKRYSTNVIGALLTILMFSILTHFPGAFSVDLWGIKVEYVGPPQHHIEQVAQLLSAQP